MKNVQKGSVGIVLIVIVALLVGVAGTYTVMSKKNVDQTPEYKESVDNSTYEAAEVMANKEPRPVDLPKQSDTKTEASQNALTEKEILEAKYQLSANFGGTKTVAREISFPYKGSSGSLLTGITYLNKFGEVVGSGGQDIEAFAIRGYKYTDNAYTEAKVVIMGSYGASGYDDRLFVVNKINGKVVTKEIPCKNRASNGSCTIDAN